MPVDLTTRRKHPRVELLAQVQCKVGDEVHILEVHNASLGGIFLAGKPSDYPTLVPGARVMLALMPSVDPSGDPILMQCEILRSQAASGTHPPGFGCRILTIDPRCRERFEDLIGAR
jgi:hypothetical protein